MKNVELNDAKTAGAASPPKIRLIHDAPTAEDSFGAHDLLADAVAGTIRDEEGGKAIALEGGWGSGKSSIVEMLQKRFRETANDGNGNGDAVNVFVFDAWSHEGDPLRRVFLEELLQFCNVKLNTDQKKSWKTRERTEITGRSKVIKQSSSSVLRSSWPLLVIAFLSAFPIAIAAFSGLFRQNLADDYILPLLLASFGVAAVVPFGLSILFLYCAWPFPPFSWWKWASPKTSKEKRREKAGRLISLYAKKVDENVETTAHETQGPTSIEFQRYFAGLMKDYLDEPRRKILVVLDNLDRIPTASAKSLWATLRVFADCCEDPRNNQWSRRVWFLVPYDPASASRLWDDGEESQDQHSKETTEGNSLPKDVDQALALRSAPTPPRLSSAFLDKTFQVRFDVPPLLLNDWKQFLKTQLQACLGTTLASEAEVHKIYLLSRRMSETKRRPPTPRHLKLFSNDIAALCRRFKQAFPVSHFALYAMLRRQGHDVRLWLLENHDDHRLYESVLGGNEYKSTLCAMAHGILDEERARDLHLKTPISDAIASADAESLAELSSSYGFWQVIEVLCDDPIDSFGSDQEHALNALEAIEESKLLQNSEPEVVSIEGFIERLVREAEWQSLDSLNAVGFVRAARLGVNEEVLTSLISRLGLLKDDVENLDPEEWVNGLQVVTSFLHDEGRISEFKGAITLTPTTADRILPLIGAQADADLYQNAMLLDLQSPSEQVSTYLPESGVEWDEGKSQSMRAAIAVLSDRIDGKPVTKALQARFSSDEELKRPEIDRITRVFSQLELRTDVTVSQPLKSMAENGILYRRVKNCERSPESLTMSTLFRWLVRFASLGSVPASPTSAPEGYQLVKAIADKPEEHQAAVAEIVSDCLPSDQSGMLNAVLIEVANTPALTAAVVSAVRDEGKLGTVLTATLYCERFDELRTLATSQGEDFLPDLTNEILNDTDFASSLQKVNVGEEHALAIAELVRADAVERSEVFDGLVRSHLEQRSVEEWGNTLKGSDKVAELTISYKSAVPDFEHGGNLAQAVEDVLAELVDGELTGSSVAKDWNEILKIIPRSWQQTIAGRVVERSDSLDKHLDVAISFLSEPLVEAAARHNEDSFVRNTLSRLIKNPGMDVVAWLAEVTSRGLKCWNVTSEGDRMTFADELRSAFRASDGELSEKIKLIAEHLKIEIESEEATEQSEEST